MTVRECYIFSQVHIVCIPSNEMLKLLMRLPPTWEGYLTYLVWKMIVFSPKTEFEDIYI